MIIIKDENEKNNSGILTKWEKEGYNITKLGAEYIRSLNAYFLCVVIAVWRNLLFVCVRIMRCACVTMLVRDITMRLLKI